MTQISRRILLQLAGASSVTAALAGAVRAEGAQNGSSSASVEPLFGASTPITVGAAALRVRQLDPMVAYYRDTIGLREIRRDGATVVMGTGDAELLHLVPTPQASLEPPTQAGLFHIAFLMPSRQALAQWLVHVAANRVPLTGFADHTVSEAIYLTDPEGNGIEVYGDRPRNQWKSDSGVVTMGTHPLDVDSILALANGRYSGSFTAPSGMVIGHVHLRVGDITDGRRFYQDELGLTSTRGARKDAAFVSSGGYHHHIAMNIWNSRGAGQRDPALTGLDWFSLHVRETGLLDGQQERLNTAGRALTKLSGGVETIDPWGTKVRLIG